MLESPMCILSVLYVKCERFMSLARLQLPLLFVSFECSCPVLTVFALSY